MSSYCLKFSFITDISMPFLLSILDFNNFWGGRGRHLGILCMKCYCVTVSSDCCAVLPWSIWKVLLRKWVCWAKDCWKAAIKAGLLAMPLKYYRNDRFLLSCKSPSFSSFVSGWLDTQYEDSNNNSHKKRQSKPHCQEDPSLWFNHSSSNNSWSLQQFLLI